MSDKRPWGNKYAIYIYVYGNCVCEATWNVEQPDAQKILNFEDAPTMIVNVAMPEAKRSTHLLARCDDCFFKDWGALGSAGMHYL